MELFSFIFFLVVIAGIFILLSPVIVVMLSIALCIALFMGFILLLWAITENIMLSILIFCTIVVMNLIYHRESVKEFFANR
ncbi:hypothetical protein ACE4RU_06775 [Actinobacillus seminis]|uniref:hypothetical protein n=1 Tax=Actinobacillus seminis TaxID=722 RepID=UPI003B93E8F9